MRDNRYLAPDEMRLLARFWQSASGRNEDSRVLMVGQAGMNALRDTLLKNTPQIPIDLERIWAPVSASFSC